MKVIKLYTDGGSRGNPGPAAIGVIIRAEDGSVLGEYGRHIGIATNNEAEYQALVYGLELVSHYTPCAVEVYLDSELVCNQVNGSYKIKDAKLIPHYQNIMQARLGFKSFSCRHIPRERNTDADRLVNVALDTATAAKKRSLT